MTKKVYFWVDENGKFGGFYDSIGELALDLANAGPVENDWTDKQILKLFENLENFCKIGKIDVPYEIYEKNKDNNAILDADEVFPDYYEFGFDEKYNFESVSAHELLKAYKKGG